MNDPLRARTLAAVTGLFLLAGCTSGTPSNGPESPTRSPTGSSPAPTSEPTPIADPFHVQLNDADNGEIADLAVGGTLVVALPLDPATDAVWFIGEGTGEQLGESCGTHPITNRAGTTQTLTFGALAAGTAPLFLELKTPETPMDPASTFAATIQIAEVPAVTPPAGVPTELILREADNGTTVELANRGRLVVLLAGQPRLGYTWSLADYSQDLITMYCPMNLVPPGSTVEPPPETPWESSFTFSAIRTGAAEIVLEYRHEDAPDAAPDKTFRVTVAIR